MSQLTSALDLNEYRANYAAYEDAALLARQVIHESLFGFVHGVQEVQARAKDPDSAAEKTLRSDGELTDLIGVRVITLFDSAVQPVVERLEKVFRNYPALAKDKTAETPEKQVGYRGHHIFIKLKGRAPSLGGGAGASILEDVLIEVQVKSLAAHTWAEAEHSLRYKAGNIPLDISRRFDYLAGALALVDRELSTIEDDLVRHVQILSANYKMAVNLDAPVSAVELLAVLDFTRPKMLALGPQGLKLDIEDAYRLAKRLTAIGHASVGALIDSIRDTRTAAAILNYLDTSEENESLDPESISATILLAAVIGQRDTETLSRSSFFAQTNQLPERMAAAIAMEDA